MLGSADAETLAGTLARADRGAGEPDCGSARRADGSSHGVRGQSVLAQDGPSIEELRMGRRVSAPLQRARRRRRPRVRSVQAYVRLFRSSVASPDGHATALDVIAVGIAFDVRPIDDRAVRGTDARADREGLQESLSVSSPGLFALGRSLLSRRDECNCSEQRPDNHQRVARRRPGHILATGLRERFLRELVDEHQRDRAHQRNERDSPR